MSENEHASVFPNFYSVNVSFFAGDQCLYGLNRLLESPESTLYTHGLIPFVFILPSPCCLSTLGPTESFVTVTVSSQATPRIF